MQIHLWQAKGVYLFPRDYSLQWISGSNSNDIYPLLSHPNTATISQVVTKTESQQILESYPHIIFNRFILVTNSVREGSTHTGASFPQEVI